MPDEAGEGADITGDRAGYCGRDGEEGDEEDAGDAGESGPDAVATFAMRALRPPLPPDLLLVDCCGANGTSAMGAARRIASTTSET